MKKEILFLEETNKLGGAQYNNILLQKFKPVDFKSTVLIPRDSRGQLDRELDYPEVDVILYSKAHLKPLSIYFLGKKITNPAAIFFNLLGVVTNAVRVRRIIRNSNSKVLVTNGMMAHLYGGLACLGLSVKCVWRLEDIVSRKQLFGLAILLFELLSVLLPDEIIVPSDAVFKANFKVFGRRIKTSTIYNSVDLSEFSRNLPKIKELASIKESVIVGISSRLIPWKGHVEFLKAAIRCLDTCKNVHFVIVGGSLFSKTSSYEDELKNIVKVSRKEDHFTFLGFRRDINSCMNSLDIVVLPSILPDPCPRVMFEAMALGKPILTSGMGGISEVVIDGINGRIINPFDTEEFAQSIKELVLNHELRKYMGEQGRNRLLNRFKLETYISKHYLVFNS